MPGAPNSPPKIAAPTTPAAPVDELARRVLRRLGPSRIALHLDVWKGAPARELLEPFDRAEKLYEAQDYRGADSALDQLSVRFAEPRWPTLPEPFKGLRVRIPAPMPPHYDPEFALPAEEKERRRRHREAELQVALAKASVAWASAHAFPTTDLAPLVAQAEASIAQPDNDAAIWTELDAIWSGIRARVPPPAARPPAGGAGRPSVEPPAAASEEP